MRPIWRRRYDESPFPERWDYPLEALREDIGNVIVHRDYSDPGNIQVCIFDDRPEI
jgi:predicted HTH transcriptional regulator